MPDALATGCLAIIGKFDGALVILMEQGGDTVSLCLHEIFRPEGLWEDVVNAQ